MKRPAHATAAMLAAVVLAGCQPTATPTSPTPTSPSASTVSPVPTPTYQCTPEAGGEATPCTQIQHEDMKAKDRLYAEAEAVFREGFAESVRIRRAGGVTEPTAVMLRTMDGFYLEDVLSTFQRQHERGTVTKGEDPKIVTVERLIQSKAGSIVALAICVDATGWGSYKGDERVNDGGISIDDTYFARIEGTLKMIGADGREAESCD